MAVVVAQLVEQLLPILEVRCSNPVIGKIYIEHFTVNCVEKTNIEKKAGNGPLLKNWFMATQILGKVMIMFQLHFHYRIILGLNPGLLLFISVFSVSESESD